MSSSSSPSSSPPTTIKQWTTTQNGIDNISQSTTPLPIPGPNEVLVKIHAVALNYRDTEVIMGLYNHHSPSPNSSSTPPPLIPCSDLSGTIITSNSSLWVPGDQVLSIFNQTHLRGQITSKDMASGLGLPLPGVLVEYRVFPAEGLVRKPGYLSHEEAATLPIAGVTAWMGINGMREVGKWAGRDGDDGEKLKVLILGTGGVAVAGLQIARASGAEVLITSSSNTKLDRARTLGATHTLNYALNPHWDTTVLSLTSNHGVDIILETGGALTLRKSFSCIAFGGLINCIGYLSGKEDASSDSSPNEEKENTHVSVLALRRNVTLKGILNGSKERFEEMLSFYEEKRITPVVDRVFAFEEAREALRYLYQGGHFGKVVVRVSDDE